MLDKITKDLLDQLFDGVYFVNRDRVFYHWNKTAEKISGFTAAEVIGKNCSDNILRHVDDAGNKLCEGTCPLSETIADGKIREALVYLHHKDGHRVPVHIRTLPLKDETNAIIGGVEIFCEKVIRPAEPSILKDLAKKAFRDNLTGLVNKGYAENKLASLLGELSSDIVAFSVLLIDINNFKEINLSHGSLVGDQLVLTIAKTLTNSVGPLDIVCRWYGGFLVIVDMAKKSGLLLLANKLQTLIEQSTPIPSLPEIKAAVTIGGTVAKNEDSVDTLIKRAERQLFHARTTEKYLASIDEVK